MLVGEESNKRNSPGFCLGLKGTIWVRFGVKTLGAFLEVLSTVATTVGVSGPLLLVVVLAPVYPMDFSSCKVQGIRLLNLYRSTSHEVSELFN